MIVIGRNRDRRAGYDARSAKVLQVRAQPQGVLVFWSTRLSWQLRLRVALTVHTDGPAVDSRWAQLKGSPAAQDYLSPRAPGTPLGPTPGSAQALARHHFALVVAQVKSIDWLELHRGQHRRAAFDAAGSRWLVP